MKREEMLQIVEGIIAKVELCEISIEDASEKIVKVFEESLRESIGEAKR